MENKFCLKIIKAYLNNKDDFFKYVDTNYPDLFKKDNNKIIEEIIIIKNYLTTNELNSIIEDIFNYLSNLIKLNLTANNLTLIPDNFTKLTNLKILILNNNKITKIQNLNNMNELERLELRGNKIEKIEGLNFPHKIKTLTLSSNLIKLIEKDDLSKNDYLEELGLFGNYLGDNENEINNKQILNDICKILSQNFINLKSLYIGGNYISKINTFKLIIKNEIKSLKLLDGHNI